ncbi:hypothetical protein JHK87_006610 [Glycine soja]|nr:hypothetical protein JHK87_006610 [Glycine soja]
MDESWTSISNYITWLSRVGFNGVLDACCSKKSRKGKSPRKGGNRFWKSIVVGFKTPREAIEVMSLLSCFETNCLTLYISCLLCCSGDFFVFFSRCQGSLLIVFCVLVSDQCWLGISLPLMTIDNRCSLIHEVDGLSVHHLFNSWFITGRDCVFERMIADLVVESDNHLYSYAVQVSFAVDGTLLLASLSVKKNGQAFCDIEAVYTFEGMYDINTLVTGREITVEKKKENLRNF